MYTKENYEKDINPDVILGNTYHLYLRPQTTILEKAGGLHKFNGWDRTICLPDSGGYQVYSLAWLLRKIKGRRSHLSVHILVAEKHTFTPENVMEIQRDNRGRYHHGI